MSINTVKIDLDDTRKNIIIKALSKVIDFCNNDREHLNCYGQSVYKHMKEPYDQLLDKAQKAQDSICVLSSTGEISCLIHALDKYDDKYAKDFAYEIKRADRQASMCKTAFSITCTLDINNRISTSNNDDY